MPLPLDDDVVSEDATRTYAASLGLVLPHAEQVQFLTRLDSFDVQAAPGCGKTTLIGLKLCLLASGWTSERQGICVLTYTNTAKDQIRSILESDASGRRLLRFPHFVGTFQSFVDTYLTLPHLRSMGIELRAIDDDYYAEAALRMLEHGSNSKLRYMLATRTNGHELLTSATYKYDNEGLGIYAASGSLPFSLITPSGQQYVAIKDSLRQRGIFRFADMFALATQYLAEHDGLTESLRWRFPILLIDEMQDTRAIEEELLNPLFDHEHCVMQRVGDVNQRIFGSDGNAEPSGFPRDGYLSLPQTMRFGQAIATAASALTLTQQQDIVGLQDPQAPPLVLICFRDGDQTSVPARFATIVAELLAPEARATDPIKILGSRKSSGANAVPKALTCYSPFYRKAGVSTTRPANLFRAVANAQALLRDRGRTAEAANHLWVAMCELLRVWEVQIEGRPVSRRKLQGAIADLSQHGLVSFKVGLRALLDLNLNDQDACEAAAQSLLGDFEEMFEKTPTQEARDFCSYDETECVADARANTEGCFLTIETATGDITLEFDTIHNAKGETHAATLIVECYSKDQIHDLKEVLPALIGRQAARRAGMVSVKKAGQVLFVGMTRPRHLLAFAVLKSHVEGDLHLYRQAGWRVEDMTLEAE